ncbi:MAG: hypothetical protein ACTSXO_02015 [Candidatus Heimdallarchaeota archaeon]
MSDFQTEKIAKSTISLEVIWVGFLIAQIFVMVTFGPIILAEINASSEAEGNLISILFISVLISLLCLVSFILLLFDVMTKRERIALKKAPLIMAIISAFLFAFQIIVVFLTFMDVIGAS